MKIILLDMDGVLLRSAGYHRALTDTVLAVSRALGLPDFSLPADDIARFEGLGITNEWHSGAACAALMTLSLDGMGEASGRSARGRQRLRSYLDRLFQILSLQARDISPLIRVSDALRILASDQCLDPTTAMEIVARSESADDSLTHKLFQEMVLGSDAFEETYGLQSRLATESYLELYDQPLITTAMVRRLLLWIEAPECGAAILTNRPSRSISGSVGTPEAQIGARVTGLHGLPIVGQGEIAWLARRSGLEVDSLLKPAEAHALAAIRAAAGHPIEDSLLRAISKKSAEGWPFVEDGVVIVIEDTTTGLISAEKAMLKLRSAGVDCELRKIGIATEVAKRRALAEQGARLYASVNEALKSIL